MSAEIDPSATWRALVRTPHFWLVLALTIVASLQRHGVIPMSGAKWVETVNALMDVAAGYGVTALSQFSPPRRTWSNAERVAKGLSPLPAGETRS
jgi:hypothetical protein